ncbi:MAG: 3-deoxy-D-manno-octulosonic acid transferase [Tenacibaculum sp.]
MQWLYNISIQFVYFLLKIIAFFNEKIKLFIEGRKESFKKLSVISKCDKVFWIHAASLGEFEQGRPVLELLTQYYPNHKIVLTFFSPSGYQITKNYPYATVVCYLPFDTKKNMKRFVNLINPEIALLIKYEFWPNLLQQLQQNKVKTVLVSGIFRKNQIFFKSYGGFMRKKLKVFDYFFVQNQVSKKLLNTINFNNASVSGDTRFDRVFKIVQQSKCISFIETFINNSYTVVAGSTWKEDEALFINYINKYADAEQKFIIVPHLVNIGNIANLKEALSKKTLLFSETEKLNLKLTLPDYQVLIIDTVGILTKIYAYATVAYVGGGLRTGLHNILEPAAYGVPLVFGGRKYSKFKEATDLLKQKGAFSIVSNTDFNHTFTLLKNNENLRGKMGKINKQYIKNNLGASQKIIEYIKNSI